MELFGRMNRILDGVGTLLGAPTEFGEDSRISLDRLRCKRGKGLDSVAVSMAMISRPIMRETLIEVREAKKNKRAEGGHARNALCSK